MINKEDILNICETALTDRQFVVEVKVSRSNEIIVSIDDFDGLSIEECRRINHVIESNLDREKEDYSLEVGSPGLSNPFKVIGQYLKSINKEVEIVLEDGEKIIGTLLFADENEITVSRTFTKKIENKKQQITEESKIKIKEIKSTRSVISFK